MTRCADTRSRVDRFEAHAQTDIAKMTHRATAANECSVIVKLADDSEVLVQQFSQLVRYEDAP